MISNIQNRVIDIKSWMTANMLQLNMEQLNMEVLVLMNKASEIILPWKIESVDTSTVTTIE